MTSAHFTNRVKPQRHSVHKGFLISFPEFFLCELCAFVVINEICSSSSQVETLSEQIPYGLQLCMQLLQHFLGRGLFFAASGRQMLSGALDGELSVIEQVFDF